MPSSNAYVTTAEVVASLMWGPKTYAELQDATGVSKWTIAKTIAALRQSGVVRVVRRPSGGYTVHLQAQPFAAPDVGWVPAPSPTAYRLGQPRSNPTPAYGGQPRDTDAVK